MDDEERQRLEELLRQHQRRLHLLETQKAIRGMNTPPEVLIEIDDIRSEIARIQAQLYGQIGVSAPKQTDVSAPPPAPPVEPIDLKRLRKQALAAFYTRNWERAVMLLAQLTAAELGDEDVWTKLARIAIFGKGDVMRTAIEIPRDEITDFCRRNHVRQLSLFGSVLRSDFRPDSDIDVLVEFESGHVPGLALIRMQDELSALFGGRPVDLVTPKFLNHHIRDKVLADAELIYARG